MEKLKKQIESYSSFFGIRYSTIAPQCGCTYEDFLAWLLSDGQLSEREIARIIAYLKKNDWR